jgi:hypothetical protein
MGLSVVSIQLPVRSGPFGFGGTDAQAANTTAIPTNIKLLIVFIANSSSRACQ